MDLGRMWASTASEGRLSGLESEFEKTEEGRERARSSGLSDGEEGVEAENPRGTERRFADALPPDARRGEPGGEVGESERLDGGRFRGGEGDDA